MKRNVRNIMMVICCIVLCFALVGIASADKKVADDEERITGEAEITQVDGLNVLSIDLEIPIVKIYGLVDCSLTENSKMYKLSCNGQGLSALFGIIPLILDEAVPVELEECEAVVCDGEDGCAEMEGYGQATLATNYVTGSSPDLSDITANISLTCFFKK